MSDLKISYKVPMVDYTPARLYMGNDWVIQFKAKDPHTGRLKKVRYKFNRIKDLKQRKKEALRICEELTARLHSGWNPFLEEKITKGFTPLEESIGDFLRQMKKSRDDKAMRPDTYRTYHACLRVFQKWLGPQRQHWPSIKLTSSLIDSFLEYIYLERESTARTRNNYRSVFVRMCSWMIQKKYLENDPMTHIPKLRESVKQRKVIPREELERILSHLKQNDKPYWVMCLTIYYAFIRRTELTKLRVSHVNLERQTIFIPGHLSKANRDDHIVTMPGELVEAMRGHIENACPEDYLFADEGFAAGGTAILPERITDRWQRLRRRLDLPREYQFYSLKDTGITDMLRQGVPSVIVRDQARHHSIAVTDLYTPKETQNATPELLSYSQHLNSPNH